MHILRNATVGALLLAIGLGAGVSQRTFAAPTQAKTKSVTVKEVKNKYLYSPAAVTVKVGTRVIWSNKTDAPHTITGKGSLSSVNKPLQSGKTTSVMFSKKGTFKYYCTIHPYMKGTVKVT